MIHLIILHVEIFMTAINLSKRVMTWGCHIIYIIPVWGSWLKRVSWSPKI
jgi:hypothetical protein